ncbi:unnamed protein product, partial [Mycena citricolor]
FAPCYALNRFRAGVYIPRPISLAELIPISPLPLNKHHLNTMGSIFSAIGRGIMAIIGAIANVLETIVGAITTVIVTIFDVIVDILCCRCFGSRKSGRRYGRHKRGGAAGTY